jgi:hypothetical protein
VAARASDLCSISFDGTRVKEGLQILSKAFPVRLDRCKIPALGPPRLQNRSLSGQRNRDGSVAAIDSGSTSKTFGFYGD